MPMEVHATVQILYHALAAFFGGLLVANLFRERSLRDQVLAAIAVIPLVLRVLGVK